MRPENLRLWVNQRRRLLFFAPGHKFHFLVNRLTKKWNLWPGRKIIPSIHDPAASALSHKSTYLHIQQQRVPSFFDSTHARCGSARIHVSESRPYEVHIHDGYYGSARTRVHHKHRALIRYASAYTLVRNAHFTNSCSKFGALVIAVETLNGWQYQGNCRWSSCRLGFWIRRRPVVPSASIKAAGTKCGEEDPNLVQCRYPSSRSSSQLRQKYQEEIVTRGVKGGSCRGT